MLDTKLGNHQLAKTHPKLGMSGGTVTARRTLASTTSRIYPTLAARQRKLRDASPVRRSPIRASEHDQPSFDDRASCMPSSGRTEQLDEREKKFLRLLLEMANMRVEGTDKGARMS